MYQTHHQYLTRDSNPVLRFRKPPCIHHTRKASFLRIGKILPARITHHASRITHHTSQASVPRQGFEPRLAVPKTAVRPSHSQGKQFSQVGRMAACGRRLPCAINARADDWIRTSMIRFTRAAPFCFEPRRLILRDTQGLRRASNGARIRTPYSGFGGRPLSQEHAAVFAGHTGFGFPKRAAKRASHPKVSCGHFAACCFSETKRPRDAWDRHASREHLKFPAPRSNTLH